MTSLPECFARVLKIRREAAELSQEEFADICGLHRTYIGSVERGERNLTLNSLHTLAKALNVKMAEILRGLD